MTERYRGGRRWPSFAVGALGFFGVLTLNYDSSEYTGTLDPSQQLYTPNVPANLETTTDGSNWQELLLASVPDTPHEGIPHGVPQGYDWRTAAKFRKVDPPADQAYGNFWGQIFVDDSNYRPSNTRVAVRDCRFYILKNNATEWNMLQDTSATGLKGGAWTEDFHGENGDLDIRNEPDGSQSFVPPQGYNAHFYDAELSSPVPIGVDNREALVTCMARLVLDNPSGPDDRGDSRYLLGVGADHRRPDWNCPVSERSGKTVCGALGIGPHKYVSQEWEAFVFSSMTAEDLRTVPPPPAIAFSAPSN